MDNENNIGYLFGSIGFKSPKDVELLIENLNSEQALIFVTKALDDAYNKGVFSMIESEIISKSIRILTSQDSQK